MTISRSAENIVRHSYSHTFSQQSIIIIMLDKSTAK